MWFERRGGGGSDIRGADGKIYEEIREAMKAQPKLVAQMGYTEIPRVEALKVRVHRIRTRLAKALAEETH